MGAESPRAGDSVITKNATGTYDVATVNAVGQFQPHRDALPSLALACDAARAGLDVGGRIWVVHYSTPRQFERL